MTIMESIAALLMVGVIVVFIRFYRKKNQAWMEIVPGLLPLLGLVLTMSGVMYGLFYYDAQKPDSIEILLNGLKFAFIGSILGILGSIFFQIWGRVFLSKGKEGNLDPESQKIKLILGELIGEFHKFNRQLTHEMNLNSRDMLDRIDRLVESLESKNHIQSQWFQVLDESNQAIVTELREGLAGQTNTLLAIHEIASDVADILPMHHRERMNTARQQLDELKALIGGLGDLLQKNNTEALVKVMQSATREFNKQMSAIVDSLVKENFQELNASVKNMIVWQEQNREAMQSLNQHYQLFREGMEQTRREMAEIAAHTAMLSGPKGELGVLVQELKNLLLDPKPLSELTDKMVEAMRIATEQLELTHALNEKISLWSSQFKGLEDTTVRLIKSIEDIRNFESDVWKNYRREMQQAVDIIHNAQEDLRESMEKVVTKWNQGYADNLNSIFNTLDVMLQRYLNKLSD
jgi:hypothetical protein